MGVIYEPRGRAREYSPLAVNIYRGCGHGCLYCYAPAATFTSRREFVKAKPRKKILEKIRKEAPMYKDKEPILLCFTCDPYQPLDSELRLTRQAIEVLLGAGCAVNVLTKGGTRACRDFDLLKKDSRNMFGTTLTFLSGVASSRWEPNAAMPRDRILALKKAHDAGIRTWVSLEPVFGVDLALRIIDETYEFVDVYKIGKLNYNKRASLIDWRLLKVRAVDKLQTLGKEYYLKSDIARL
jgi:DNA repair photolyase